MKKALFTMFIFGILAVAAFSSKASAQIWYGNSGYVNSGWNNNWNNGWNNNWNNGWNNNWNNGWNNGWGNFYDYNYGFGGCSYYVSCGLYQPIMQQPIYAGYNPFGFGNQFGGFGGGMSIGLGFIFR